MTNIADDIICYGANEQEHNLNVIKFLDRYIEVDMHLNPQKVKFKSPEVPFYGNLLTKDGIKPDPKKVEPIQAGLFQSINNNYRASWGQLTIFLTS